MADRGGGPQRTRGGQWPEQWEQGRQVGRCRSLLQLTGPAGLCLGRAEITRSPSFLLGHRS